jgi:hypothetical protein
LGIKGYFNIPASEIIALKGKVFSMDISSKCMEVINTQVNIIILLYEEEKSETIAKKAID